MAKKKQYTVRVSYKVYEYYDVDATSEEKAIEKALEKAGDDSLNDFMQEGDGEGVVTIINGKPTEPKRDDEPEKVWIVKQESNDDGEMHFFTQPCKDEATAKSVLREWKEALLTKHPKYCDAKPYINGEKDPDDQMCCFEWEDHDAGFYIKILGDDYYENITIEEEEIR